MTIDDSAFMRQVLRNILEKGGYRDIIEADDGDTGVAAYRKLKPDLVLLDIIMARVTGIDALKQIKEINPNAKVVMITAVGQEAMMKEAIAAGADDYITKPFEEEKVLEAIKAVLSTP
ncbi:MAG: response regulator [Candidatus Hydrothermarchaeales archaeon]